MSFINTFHYNKPIQSFIKKTSTAASQNQAYNPLANVFYAAGGTSGTEPINIFDADSLQLIGTFNANSNRTRGIIYNPVNNRIYVQSNPLPTGITTTYVFDCTSKDLVDTIPSFASNVRYRGLATPDYTYIPFGSTGTGGATTGGFYKIHTTTGVVTKVNHGRGWGQTCAWDSSRNRLWMPIQDNTYNYLMIYDLNTDTVVYTSTSEGRTNPPFYGFTSAVNMYDPINDVVYMTEEYSGTLYKLNAATGARISSASMGSDTEPGYSIAFNNDYSEIYTTCSTKFQVWDAVTMTEKYNVPIGVLGGNASVIKRKDGSLVFINSSGLYEPIIN
jgi:hypothetical protein